MRKVGADERPEDVRAAIHPVQRQAQRKAEEHLDPSGPGNRGQARVRDRLGQSDVDVQPERRRDLVLEKLPQAAMPWIDPAQQLALVVSEGDGVIGLPRSGLPRRFLAGQHDRQSIEVGDDAAIDGLVDREQPGLVCQELTDGDALFALLRELRPVRAHPFFVIEPAARVRDGKRHRGQALGGRVDDHHRVLLPGLARLLVSDTAPDVDDLLAAVIGTAGAAQLAASSEVLDERLAHGLKPGLTCPFVRVIRAKT